MRKCKLRKINVEMQKKKGKGKNIYNIKHFSPVLLDHIEQLAWLKLND